MRRPGHHHHHRGRSGLMAALRLGGGGSFPLIALIALMFLGQLVIISYMRAHNSCNTAPSGGQPLSLVRSEGLADDGATNGYFGAEDDEASGDDDPDGLMAGLDDDDYEPIVGEDGVWGDQGDDDGSEAEDGGSGVGAAAKTPKGYEEDLLPRIKKPMIVGAYACFCVALCM